MLPKSLILLLATYLEVRILAIKFEPNWEWQDKLPIMIGGIIGFACWCWVVAEVVFGF